MKTPRIVTAMNYIDDDFVSWATEYQRTPSSICLFRKPFLKACACFFAIVLIFGFAFFHGENSNVGSSPFILTAYAKSLENGSTTTSVLEKGKKVPISRFETENGLIGFVVSYNKQNDSQPSSIAIISAGQYDKQIDEIIDIADDPTQNYYFYIPGENEVEPFILHLFITDEKNKSECQYQITISQTDGAYYAELVEENILQHIAK